MKKKKWEGGGVKNPTSNENEDITNGLISNAVQLLPLVQWCVNMFLVWNIYLCKKKEIILEARFIKLFIYIYILVYINSIQSSGYLFIFDIKEAQWSTN